MLGLFSKYLLIGLSAITLLVGAQQGLFNRQISVTQAAACDPNSDVDPETWSLIEEWECEPGNPGVKAHKWACFGDDGTPQAIKYTDGVSDIDKCPLPFQPEPVAPAQAAAPSGQVCEKKDVIGTVEDCAGSQVCTFNIWQGPKADGSCQTGRGGAYNCRTVAGQCGVSVREVRVEIPGRSAPAAPAQGGNITVTNNPTFTNNPTNTNTNTNTNTITNNVTKEVVREVQTPQQVVLTRTVEGRGGGNVGVGTTVVSGQVLAVKELPKTGLPALAWTALAFVPTGFGLRRFAKIKKALENHPNYIFENRQFKSES